MRFELSSLLQLLIDDELPAVYLIEGLPPVIAMRMEQTKTEPSASLHSVEGPELTREDLVSVLALLNIPIRETTVRERSALNQILTEANIAPIPYTGTMETVYNFGSTVFDVFTFQSERAIHIEFRLRD